MEEIPEEDYFSSSSSPPSYPLSNVEKEKNKNCIVCQDYRISKSEGPQTCFYCEEFFRHSMKICADYVCNDSPSCIANASNKRNCDFCRMEKCFNLKMKDIITYDADSSLREQKKMGTSNFNGVKTDQEEKWARALQSFNRYEILFHQWLSVLPEYQSLREDQQALLKERYRLRAVITQLIEESLYLHQVLKFDRCYWNPWNYPKNDVTILLAKILSIILHLEDEHVSLEGFKILKLRLVLKDNVFMRDTEINRVLFQLLEEKLDDAENLLSRILNGRGNVTGEISHEDVYTSEPPPPDHNFSDHDIDMEL